LVGLSSSLPTVWWNILDWQIASDFVIRLFLGLKRSGLFALFIDEENSFLTECIGLQSWLLDTIFFHVLLPQARAQKELRGVTADQIKE
jgi:hypothetical protein